MAVVGPKITPPWDSAAASLGKGILQALACLGIDSFVVTTRVNLKQIVSNYGFIPEGVRDLDYFSAIQAVWYVTAHCRNQLRNEARLLVLARKIIGHERPDAVIYIGLPRVPSIIHSFNGLCRILVLYPYTSISNQYLLYLRNSLLRINRTRVIILTPSIYVYKQIKHNINIINTYLMPPVVDTDTFKPLDIGNAGKKHSHSEYLCIGYAGPIHPSRFPIKLMAKIIKYLKDNDTKVILRIRSLLRHGKRDWLHVHFIRVVMEKVLGSNDIDIQVGQLSRIGLNKFYNSNDILLYLFENSKQAEIADPPLVPLEALSAGTPVILSAGSSLDFYLRPLDKADIVKIVRNREHEIIEAVCELAQRKNRNKLALLAHRYIGHVFSPKATGLKIKKILEEML